MVKSSLIPRWMWWALPKLGYEVDVNSFEEKNLKGLSTQIAYAPMVRVKGRIRREIKVRGTALRYETS